MRAIQHTLIPSFVQRLLAAVSLGFMMATGEFNVATVKVEGDVGYNTAYYKKNVNVDADGEWIFPARRDCLNTHVSKSLVHWVAEQCGLPDELGKKEFVAS